MAGNTTHGKESSVAWDDLAMLRGKRQFSVQDGGSLQRLTARVRSASGGGTIRVISNATANRATARVADQASQLDEAIRRCSDHLGRGLPAWARIPARRIRPSRITAGRKITAPAGQGGLSLFSLALSS